MNENNVKKITESLINENIISIIIEGGAYTLNKYIENNCCDEIRIFQSNKIFKNGIKAPKINKKKLNYIKILDDKLFIKHNNEY